MNSVTYSSSGLPPTFPDPMYIRVMGKTLCVRSAIGGELEDENGKLFPDQAIIVYDPNIDLAHQQEVILHEIIHYVDSQLSGMAEGEQSEAMVCRMSVGLFTILRDNPVLVESLFKMNNELWIDHGTLS